jgi:hypothetical protein
MGRSGLPQMAKTTEVNSTDEVEITPAMVEAGEDVLLAVLGGGVSVHWWTDELAKRVFRAMALKRIERPMYDKLEHNPLDRDSRRGTI